MIISGRIWMMRSWSGVRFSDILEASLVMMEDWMFEDCLGRHFATPLKRAKKKYRRIYGSDGSLGCSYGNDSNMTL